MIKDRQKLEELRPSDPRFGVGPSLIPLDFTESLLKTGTSLLGTGHRRAAVTDLIKELQDGLKKYWNLPAGYEVVLGNGGATFLFDMIGLGLVKKSSAHFTCGEFSKKWYLSHKNIPWLEVDEISEEMGESITAYDTGKHDMICMTLSETSTGVMNTEIPNVGDNTLLAIDATSAAGQIPVDFKKVDLYFFSPQKIFASEGGLYIAVMSPKALKRAKELYQSEHYRPQVMRWDFAIDNSLKNQTYNTPSITSIFFANEQTKLLNSLGECEVVRLAKEKADFIYQWAESSAYLECFVKDPNARSISVATINVDERLNVSKLAAFLAKEKLAYDIEGYRKLGLNQLRISLFHNVELSNLKKLTALIDLAFSEI